MTLIHMPAASVQLTPGVFDARRRKNRDYLDSLTVANLLQNHRIEAGIGDQGWHLHPSPSLRRGPRARPSLGLGNSRIAAAGALPRTLDVGGRT